MNKLVIFDFDGTITDEDQNIWKMLWQEVGYDTSINSLYRNLFISHVVKQEITRKDWFDKTRDAFIEKNMTKQTMRNVASKIHLNRQFKDLAQFLIEKDYYIVILSGGITNIIRFVLDDCNDFVPMVVSTRAKFNNEGKFIDFSISDYDFEGKAKFVNILKERFNISSKNIVFVGNGQNDEWVCNTGCYTVCINPNETDSENKKIWKEHIKELKDVKNVILNLEKNKEEYVIFE